MDIIEESDSPFSSRVTLAYINRRTHFLVRVYYYIAMHYNFHVKITVLYL